MSKGRIISRSLPVCSLPRRESRKTNLPQNAHPRTCRCALRIASSWSSQMWSLQTRMGRIPKCHSKPWRKTAETRVMDLICPLETFCAPSKSTQPPPTARTEPWRQPEKLISWSWVETLAKAGKKKGERSFSVPSD